MFNVSKINNKKIQLITLLMVSTAINCSMIPTSLKLSDETVVSTTCPQFSGTIIAGTGLTAAGLIMIKDENSDSKVLSALSIASFGVGYVAYKYLNYFTPTSQLHKVQNIVQELNEEKCNGILNIIKEESTSVNLDKLSEIIHGKCGGTDHPEITFLSNFLTPLYSKKTLAENLIKNIKSKTKEDTNVSQELETQEKNIKEIEQILGKMSLALRNSEHLKNHKSFNNTLEQSHKSKKHIKQIELLREQNTNVQQQNSYVNSIANLIMSNPLYIQILAAYIQLFYTKIVSTFGILA